MAKMQKQPKKTEFSWSDVNNFWRARKMTYARASRLKISSIDQFVCFPWLHSLTRLYIQKMKNRKFAFWRFSYYLTKSFCKNTSNSSSWKCRISMANDPNKIIQILAAHIHPINIIWCPKLLYGKQTNYRETILSSHDPPMTKISKNGPKTAGSGARAKFTERAPPASDYHFVIRLSVFSPYIVSWDYKMKILKFGISTWAYFLILVPSKV